MSDTQGIFVWYELMTTDVPGAIAFYRDVVGWTTEPFGGGTEPYTIWKAGDVPIGGVIALTDEGKKAGARPHWYAHVLADDVDALAKKAVSLGATSCVPPQDIPTVGRFSIIADPEGAVLSLFKPTRGDAPPRPSGPGARPRRVARAPRQRLGSRVPFLRRPARLGEVPGDGHGRHGHLPDLRIQTRLA